MGKISIEGLRVNAIIGELPYERERRQELTLDVTLETDFSAAAASDDLTDAVNYADVEERIVSLCDSSSYHLLESLCQAVCHLVMSYPAVSRVRCRIGKPGGARHSRRIAVEEEMSR